MMLKEQSILTIDEYGTKRWQNKEGKYHRINGPAIKWRSGTNFWYQNGLLHRIVNPAIEWSNGRREWYQKGKRHRIDGPAIDYGDGRILWYIRGVHFKRKEDFFDALTDEEKSIALFSEDFHNA